MRPILLILMLLISAAAAIAQEATPPTPVSIDSIYLAKDDGTGQAGDAAKSFLPTDIPIYCVVVLDSVTPVTVKMNLVAEKVPGVKADTKVVSISYTTKDGQNRVNFTGKPAGKWVVGLYRADIFLDDKLAKNVTFEIRPPLKNVESATLFQPKGTAKSNAAKKKN